MAARRAAAVVLLVLLAASCSKGGTSATDAEIVIGASIPLSGPLAGFGSFQRWGYQHAVDQVNRAGGLQVGGSRRKVRLILLDDKTDPNTTSSNTDTLVSRDKVTALLGSCTPSLVVAGAVVADRNRVPMVTGCAPLEAFKSVKRWQYVWDVFFDEPDLAEAPFKTLQAAGVRTNNKVAIVHDNGPDGAVVGGQLWPRLARQYGYTVVSRQSFPVDNTQFNSLISNARATGADVFLIDAVTPQAVTIRKQMASAGYNPQVIVAEKGAEPVQFAQALGSLADGVIVGGYWDSSFPYPGAARLRQAFEQETKQTYSQHIADSYAAAQILLDAISAAGSTQAARINDAIGRTDKTYVVGPVKFDDQHTSRLPIAELQWQGGQTKVIWPSERKNGDLLFPAS
ncbi:MAG TPA: amino acid ABC transporter substrate-binding protein [Actinomycetes bacterium]|jgi:branched-chain amino acid transport system substrate-binding protein|nr:amino acid ABC transporter substrate-binding protein [Actinomycetes bacterium]